MLVVADPLVRILERDLLPTRRHCQAMEDLVLEVHLSHAHGEVKWYKDGEKLQDTGHVRLEEDGARRSLVVLGATGRDAGEYLCDTGDDSIVFFVTVEGEWEVLGGTASGARTKAGPWQLPGWCRTGLEGSERGEAGKEDTGSRLCPCWGSVESPVLPSCSRRRSRENPAIAAPATSCCSHGDSPSLQSQSHQ